MPEMTYLCNLGCNIINKMYLFAMLLSFCTGQKLECSGKDRSRLAIVWAVS